MLALSEAERAELAHDLIQSLDEPRDDGVEDAWDREISRRIGEIDAGQAELVDRAEFRRRIPQKNLSPGSAGNGGFVVFRNKEAKR